MKKLLFLVLVGLFTSCSSSSDFEKGRKQLENQGYTNVENTGYNVFCCGKDDNFSTGFIALDRNGEEVKGCFCSSIGKGITIRFE